MSSWRSPWSGGAFESCSILLSCTIPCTSLSSYSPVCLAFPPPISSAAMTSLKEICRGLPLNPLPENKGRRKGIPHAPVRTPNLTAQEKKVTWGFTAPHFSSFQIKAACGSKPDCLKCFSEWESNFVSNVFPWCYNSLCNGTKDWKLFCLLPFFLLQNNWVDTREICCTTPSRAVVHTFKWLNQRH